MKMSVELEKKIKKTISARVDEEILETFTKQGLPLSQVIEAGIIYFLKLKEDERISFIAENSAEATEKKDLVVSAVQWQEFLKQQIGSTRARDMIELAILAKKIGSDFETTRKTLIDRGIGTSSIISSTIGTSSVVGTFAGTIAALAGIMTKNKKKE